MSRKKKSERPAVIFSHGRLTAIRLLLGGALVTALYLAWHAVTGGTLPGCGPESECDKVLQSRWSTWLGVPVTIPAILIYAGLLAVTFAASRSSSNLQLSWLRWAAAGGITLLGAALWFVGLQLVAIQSFCRFCLLAHASGLVAGILILRMTLDALKASASHRELAVRSRGFIGQGLVAGLLALIVLVIGQNAYTPPQFRTQSLEGSSTNEVAKSPEPRKLSIHGGQFTLSLDELPLMGSPTAPHAIVSLFDYTCHHCRDMHHVLRQAAQALSNQLAIVSLPMPLDADCNYTMSQTPSAHINACQYARLGLAVWRAKREAFAEFDDWIFSSPAPPPLTETRARAEQLAGRDSLEKALSEGWVEQQLKTDIAIYQANTQQMKSGQMPQLMIANTVTLGPVSNVESLYRLLEDLLKLDVPNFQ